MNKTDLTPNRRKKERPPVNQNRNLFVVDDPKSATAEQYRLLKTSIDVSPTGKSLRTIMVTSSNPSEGRSMTAANLAILYAQKRNRVLLIDADLRNPSIHHTFSLSNTIGLSNLLTGAVSFSEAVHVTDVEKLCVLTSGPIPPDPNDLLESKVMDQLFDKMLEIFDMVIFDTPAILPVRDARILSRKCDGVVLVTRSGSTKKPEIKKSLEALKKEQANVLGITLIGCENKKK